MNIATVRPGLMVGLLLASLAACVTQQQRITRMEDDLAAAGFIVRPANTPEREQMLSRLPPNKFIQRVHEDDVHYVYADPVVCHCLYVGTQTAYGAFKKHEQEQRLADQASMDAQIYSDSAWRWDGWGPWGPGFGFRYGPLGW